MDNILEERNKIIKEYERKNAFRKMIFTFVILVMISFVSALCIHIGANLLKKSIVEIDQAFMIAKVFYVLLVIIITVLIFFKSDENVVKYCVLFTVLSGGIYSNIYLKNITDILLQIGALTFVFALSIINIKKLRSKDIFWFQLDIGYFVLLGIFMTIENLIKGNFIFYKSINAICFCLFYLCITGFEGLMDDEKRSQKHITLLCATRLLVYLSVIMYTLN